MKTKIVCTIGPKTLDAKILNKLVENGMSMARLNGSHADLIWHQDAIEVIQSAIPEIPILLDLPGRKNRTINMLSDLTIEAGETIVFSGRQKRDRTQRVLVSDKDFAQRVSIGDLFYADDGTITFKVEAIDGTDVHAKCEYGGKLKNRKGINTPSSRGYQAKISKLDRDMILFAIRNNIQFVGLSFIETAKQVRSFRKISQESDLKIVSKIENRIGLENLDEIVQVSDAIMIDRGDLSVETNVFDLPFKQKHIIQKAIAFGKPVIVATEMLSNMITHNYPTKSEVIDIANAVTNGCSATMLSGETAIGDFPIQAVQTMRDILEETESHLTAGSLLESAYDSDSFSTLNAISSSVAVLCQKLPITKVIAVSRKGHLVGMLSRFNLAQEIIGVSDRHSQAISFNLFRASRGFFTQKPFPAQGVVDVTKIIQELHSNKLISEEDMIVAAGVSLPHRGARANSIHVFQVKNIIQKA